MGRPKSDFVSKYGDLIRNLYIHENKSIPEINEYFLSIGVPCNCQKVWRTLKATHTATRTPSESQKAALTSGRSTHQTEGKTV